MPLDPKRLLYTRVGQKRFPKGTVLDRGQTQMFVKIITEHAFRHVFSSHEDPRISRLRPRYVNEHAYQNEKSRMVEVGAGAVVC